MSDTIQPKQYLCVKIDKFELAIPVLNIIEIIIADERAGIFKPDADNQDIYSYRDMQIPLINLLNILDISAQNTQLSGRIIICENGPDKAALLADSADEILRLDKNNISDLPTQLAGIKSDYLSGSISVDERSINILSLDRLIRSIPAR